MNKTDELKRKIEKAKDILVLLLKKGQHTLVNNQKQVISKLKGELKGCTEQKEEDDKETQEKVQKVKEKCASFISAGAICSVLDEVFGGKK